ncbi:hypothetical protein VTK73DRAFT_6431 [Phialemonium thermophilum]|uniref:Uncharacterized protein n=1 Tax=Phialemonium thermophilum TaxID=223376 RepID=A0ABR3WJE2_9PEZI
MSIVVHKLFQILSALLGRSSLKPGTPSKAENPLKPGSLYSRFCSDARNYLGRYGEIDTTQGRILGHHVILKDREQWAVGQGSG